MATRCKPTCAKVVDISLDEGSILSRSHRRYAVPDGAVIDARHEIWFGTQASCVRSTGAAQYSEIALHVGHTRLL